MKVNGRDLDARKDTFIVDQDRTTLKERQVEAIRPEPLLKVFNCFLQGGVVPSPRT